MSGYIPCTSSSSLRALKKHLALAWVESADNWRILLESGECSGVLKVSSEGDKHCSAVRYSTTATCGVGLNSALTRVLLHPRLRGSFHSSYYNY